jgi:hypothetical protein
MDAVFSRSSYSLKRLGLSLAGKYKLFDSQSGDLLLYIEEKSKWIPPSVALHIYSDEKKTTELLTLKDSPKDGIEMDIIDAPTGQIIAGIGMAADDLAEFVKDAWSIYAPDGKPIAKVAETSTGRALLRELSHDITQKLDITIGEEAVGELRQKVKVAGYELGIDFSMDPSLRLDRRLGIATAIYVAYHQGREIDLA